MTNLSFEHISIKENDEPLVNLAEFPFILEPLYFRHGLSKTSELYARASVAQKLLFAQENILKGYLFKIWDPWRPREVQAAI